MAEAPRESNTQVTIALIGGVVAIATAIIANWDKIFPPDPEPAPSTETSASDAPAVAIAGNWHDDDGYTYLFQQNGAQFQYRMLLDGQEQSSGSGSIEGRTLRYRYAGEGNYGSCNGLLGDDDDMITGQCEDAATGQSWPFQIKR
jgi:hypothetical protein